MKKEVVDYEEREEVSLREEKVFEVQQITLFYTCVSVHYEKNLRSKRLNCTRVVEQAFYLWRKGHHFRK